MSTINARLIRMALDPEEGTANDEVADQILDAALALVAASGVRHLTMDDVAVKAKTGRMTVYRRFGNRKSLIEALAVRECRACLGRIAAAIDPEAPPNERIARWFAATVGEVRTHPLLARLARTEPEAFLSEMNAPDSAIVAMATRFLHRQIEEGQERGEIMDLQADVLAELGVRLGASFVLMPDSVIAADDQEATYRAIRQILATINPTDGER